MFANSYKRNIYVYLYVYMFSLSNLNKFLTKHTKIIYTKIDRPSPSGDSDAVEGTLTRKHEWESTTKKASNRSWDKVIKTNNCQPIISAI